jgi:hypothetical protein
MNTSKYEKLAEGFFSQLCREEYLHLSGIKDTFETEVIFQKYSPLFTREAVQDLLANQTDRAERYLAEFAAHNYIECQLRELTEEIANGESAAEVVGPDGKLAFHAAGRQVMSESDPAKRRQLEGAIAKVIASQNGLREKRIRRQGEIARELGFSDYRQLCETLSGQDFDALAADMKLFLQETEELYRIWAEAALRQEGIVLSEATAADLRWVILAPKHEDLFPVEKLISVAEATLQGMGINLKKQKNLRLDLEPRPRKYPRPFCCAIEVPGEVWVVVSPRGGCIDYLAFFHELGHAEHFSHIGADLPIPYRLFGDKAVCEGFAFTLQSIVLEKAWLERFMGLPEAPPDLLAAARLFDLYNYRRCAAKLCYELELHSKNGKPKAMAEKYAHLLADATQVKVFPEHYLFDLDDAFYCATYLRAWIFDAVLREHLRADLGRNWFLSPQAGALLEKYWRRGQAQTAEEMAREMRLSEDTAPLRRRLVERLQA